MIKLHIIKKLGAFKLDIAFESKDGCMGILGASGSGKSMILKCIAGIEKPDEGCIIINDRVLFDSQRKINLTPQQRRVGYMFQSYALFPNMTVAENIKAGIRDKKKSSAEAARQIERFLLQGLENHYPGQLSGGQQQRTALARMFAHRPDVIMLDEPFSALDGYLKEKLQHEMKQALVNYPGDILLVSHSRDDIYRFCKEVLAIDGGRVLQQGAIFDIFMKPSNFKVARLTGCNNISAAERIGTHEIYAKDWDIILKTTQQVNEAIRYVGIRSHDIMTGEENGENTFMMELFDVVESPFEYRYHMKPVNGCCAEAIWWKTYKELRPDALPESFPRNIRLPAAKLLLLEE